MGREGARWEGDDSWDIQDGHGQPMGHGELMIDLDVEDNGRAKAGGQRGPQPGGSRGYGVRMQLLPTGPALQEEE